MGGNKKDKPLSSPVYQIEEQEAYKQFEDIFNKSNAVDYVVIPGLTEFDWAVRVSGNGMYPKYSNGDILICRIVRDSFIQWGKVFVIMTKSGLLVRKLKPSSKDNHVMAETFSEDYPSFDIPRDEILDIALVIASVKFE